MSTFPDLAAVVDAIWECRQQPRGIAQAVEAERVLAGAEELGQPEALVKSLLNLVSCYEYTAERPRILVPFARVLRIWDTQPEVFDEYDVHSLHWYFKWASSGMLRVPEVSLAAIEQWLQQMRDRYRVAGYSTRPVWQAEHLIARHLGDRTRAQHALDQWSATERDDMADCHACETSDRGRWYAQLGEDATALREWGPVLDGDQTCAEEPHLVLSTALLPLVRQGRLEEAGAAHLRGYQLARGSESLTTAIANHLEFCALTGNEARGLEILAEQSAGFTDSDVQARLAFLTATALLLDRLVALGRADLPVAGPPEGPWTAAGLAEHARAEALALASRFDARNGNDAVGRRTITRMDATALVDRLPLGVRSRLAPPVVPSPDTGSETGPVEADSVEAIEAEPGEPDATEQAVMAAIERHQAAMEAGELGPARDELLLALATAVEFGSADWKSASHGRVAELSADLGEFELALHHAREATAWADLAGEPTFSRVRLGHLLMATERLQEAGEVLQHALLDLAEHPEPPEDLMVRVLRWLGECEQEAGDQLAAARRWAEAAAIAQHWEDQQDHAELSYLAGRALNYAERPDDAIVALERAARLWGELDQPLPRVYAQRVRGWIEADRNPELAGELLRATADELTARLAVVEGDLAVGLREELAETWRLHALAIVRQEEEGWAGEYPDALPEAYRSALEALSAAEAAGSDPTLVLRCHLLVGDLAIGLGDRTTAEQHLRLVAGHQPLDDQQEALREHAEILLGELD